MIKSSLLIEKLLIIEKESQKLICTIFPLETEERFLFNHQIGYRKCLLQKIYLYIYYQC